MTKDIKKLEEIFANFMTELGLDLANESLKDTPRRVAKMYANEICFGLDEANKPKVTTFDNIGKHQYDGIVIIDNIEVKSLCEHHFQPFLGKCHIAYIPKEKIIGLSKFARIVNYFSRKPQVQERLTMEIYNELSEILDTKDIAVIIKSEHLCMKIRGVEEPCSQTTTAKLGGVFENDNKIREDFYRQLKI